MGPSISTVTLEKFATFGDLLRFLRRRAGITQMELAIAVGYSDAQISRLEQNLRLPDIPTIQARFAEALYLEDEPAAVERLVELAANVRREDAPALGVCPYKGLSYFDEGDAELFVGREQLARSLMNRILALSRERGAERFLAIVGASGSGKSSLVRAGIIPALRWSKETAGWQILTLTPTARPLESLAGQLCAGGSLAEMGALIDDMAREPRSLHLFAKRDLKRQQSSHMLVVVDQFEELFALCRSEAERAAFIDNLLTAASEADGPVIAVLTLRADFYAHCAAYPELRAALAASQEYIGAMSREELRRVVEEPARRGRWDIEPGLVDLLLRGVGEGPGALPLLSHALLETWQRRRGHLLTLTGYTSSGGVRGAIAESAEAVFVDHFSREQQAIARRIFLRLTELGDEESTADTRRRAPFAELSRNREEAESVQGVLGQLAEARLVIVNDQGAEVAHEALIREWPRLRAWLEEDREVLRLHRQLSDAAQDWERLGREQGALYRGARLAQAREWAAANSAEMNALERDFLEASVNAAEQEVQERERQRRSELEAAQSLARTEQQRAEEQSRSAARLRLRNRVISAVGTVALILAIAAASFGVQARNNLQEARTSFARAESLRLAAEANVVLARAGDPQLAALLSIRALKSDTSPQADAALTAALTGLFSRQALRGHTGPIYAAAFSPDGEYVLTGSQDGSAVIWDTGYGKHGVLPLKG
ncbi:MAG: helix-turn-helix domain-containing protein, partial [Anaerolineae bacterium]